MVRRKVAKIIKIILAVILGIGVFGWIVEVLWNWLMPAIFEWHPVTFWQALGLLLLSKILFGGFRGGPGRGMDWRRRMSRRWEQMTPEERENFKRGMRGRFGRGCWPSDPRWQAEPAGGPTVTSRETN